MIVAVNKPMGWTSFDVVDKIRSLTGERKIGHAGTLDPFAAGVLVVGIGRGSTKRLSEFTNAYKVYEATLRLGLATDTLDVEGKITEQKSIPQLNESKVLAVFSLFMGTIKQVPPMYSAKKVNGQKLYELARKNITIEREAVTVEIKELLLLSLFDHSIKFRVNCSKGTYIRQLGADIAVKLDTVGHLTELTRTTVGEYKLEDCVEFAQVEEQWMSTVI